MEPPFTYHKEIDQCSTCGFLGLADTFDQRLPPLPPFNSWQRVSGEIPPNNWPRCFLGKADLPFEMVVIQSPPLTEETRRKDAVLAVIIRPNRDCGSWVRWNEYLTPHDHYEEYKMFQLEKDRREWQERLETDRKEWQERLDAQKHDTERARDEANKRSERFDRRITLILGIFVVMEVFGSLGAFMYPNGHPWFNRQVIVSVPAPDTPSSLTPVAAP